MPIKSGGKSSKSSAVSGASFDVSGATEETPRPKSKGGLRRLLDRTRSAPAPQRTCSPPTVSPQTNQAQSGAAAGRTSPSLELGIGGRVTPNNNAQDTDSGCRVTPVSSAASPVFPQPRSASVTYPSQQVRAITPPRSAYTPPAAASGGTVSLPMTVLPCSPIKDVIMEEEYEDPASVSQSITMEIDEVTETVAANGIYSEPCDTRQKKGPERSASSVTPTNYLDRIRGISRSNSIDSAANAATVTGRQSATGRSSTASSADSRHTLSESPAVSGGVECRPKPVANARTSSSAYTSMPQGNTIISHHPASPFEPIPKPNGNDADSPAKSTEGSPAQMNPTYDNPPTHEEAWDVKMTRLGLDMTHVQGSAPPVPPHQSARPRRQSQPVLETEIDGERPAHPLQRRATEHDPPGLRILVEMEGNVWSNTAKMSQSVTAGATTELSPRATHSDSISSALVRSQSSGPGGPLGLQSNQLVCPGVGIASEADLHVTTTTSTGRGPISVEEELLQAATAALATPDTDSLSTDSYDEPWDVRHGRVISELTSARLIDPSLVYPSSPSDSPSRHPQSGPLPPPRAVSPQTCSSAPPESGGPSSFFRTSDRSRSRSIGQTKPLIDAVGECIDRTLPLDEQPWFHPEVSRAMAEDLLMGSKEGSYLVRRSETNKSDFSLTIKHSRGFLHMKIARNARGQYILGQYSQPYASVPAMIHHYSRTLLPIKGADSMTLRHPVSRQSRSV